jgi:sialidase-1
MSTRLLLPVIVFSLVVPLFPAETVPSRVDVFTQGYAGFVSYRIPGIVVTAKGSVLAYCEARKFTGSDWDESEQHLRRSTDGGRSWGPAQQIAHFGPRQVPRNPHGKEAAENIGGADQQTVNNPMAIAGRDGVVHYIYCVEYMRCYYLRSDDDGLTWSKPVEITSAFEEFRQGCDWGRIATGPGHGIQLRNGRLIVPVWMASHGTDKGAKAAASVIYSDDNGKTWHGGDLATRSDADLRGVSECIATELSDGRVMLNIRNRNPANRRAAVFSADGVHGWSKPELLPDLLEPVCMAGLVTHPGTNAGGQPFLVFSNPDTLDATGGGTAEPGARRERKNLTVKASFDDGRTWPVSKGVESGPSAYSDLAVLPDGTILCFFESGQPGVYRPGKGQRPWPYAALSVARIDPAGLRPVPAKPAAAAKP